MTAPIYGSVWTNPTAKIAAILSGVTSNREKLCEIMGLGVFSQFASYRSPAFNELLVRWLTDFLEREYGFQISDLPASLHEVGPTPEATVVKSTHGTLSPDLLRHVAYVLFLRKWWTLQSDPAEILEIGSGYGGLARTLKCFHPAARFWLVDIPEALRCAEIYLRDTCPEARIAWLDADAGIPPPDSDFLLIPAADADCLIAGRRFDLAINVWSFGEMPNRYVDTYLRLLQRDCQVAWLLTVNSFMAPVTPASVDRTEVGDWLLGLDERWDIEHFEIEPAVHRCPLIRNFPKGIGLLARRISDEREISRQRQAAADELASTLLEDWAWLAASEGSAAKSGRPETAIDVSTAGSDRQPVSSRQLATLTDYIGHFTIEAGIDGPFFRLWNDYRMNRSERSGALLVAYLAMVGKTDLERRCTKEELLLLKRLPQLPLHQEYAAFGAAIERGRIEHIGTWLTAQEACDRALEHKKAGEFDAAEVLWTKVAAAYPAHGDCWFQLALLFELRCAWPWAAVFAAHSVRLGCDYYVEGAERLRTAFAASLPETKPQASLLSRWLPRRKPLQGPVTATTDAIASEVGYCQQYFAGNARPALVGLAQVRRDAGDEVSAQALDQAAARYP